jgi:putative effector of murein hydrolase LrgA (UPF0299 family)
MKKRVLSAMLWAYVAWYACNILGTFIGLALPGAVIGLAVGAVVLGMPVLRGQAVVHATAAGQPPVVPET